MGLAEAETLQFTRDSSPRRTKIAILQSLHLPGARRVVAGNAVNNAIHKTLPDLLPVVSTPDGWGTFVDGRAIRYLLGGKVEVVGTGLDRHSKPCKPESQLA